jgi:hypothetical protein
LNDSPSTKELDEALMLTGSGLRKSKKSKNNVKRL